MTTNPTAPIPQPTTKVAVDPGLAAATTQAHLNAFHFQFDESSTIQVISASPEAMNAITRMAAFGGPALDAVKAATFVGIPGLFMLGLDSPTAIGAAGAAAMAATTAGIFAGNKPKSGPARG